MGQTASHDKEGTLLRIQTSNGFFSLKNQPKENVINSTALEFLIFHFRSKTDPSVDF